VYRENRSEWAQSKEEIVVGGKNRFADQEVAKNMLYGTENSDNSIPYPRQATGGVSRPAYRVVMTAKIFAHDIIAAIIITLELTDQHIQQRHIGTVGPRDTPKGAVHETAKRKYVHQPSYHRSTTQR
jgi:hypothetical protein